MSSHARRERELELRLNTALLYSLVTAPNLAEMLATWKRVFTLSIDAAMNDKRGDSDAGKVGR